ncbi:MAG TPA: DNA polymerase ligase N-terminal domain-containing protein [Methanomassiliicoccales archaeon]|nr:DNA polymerase ligase N-terminal domain-containing protein [Methanomassiliicoccales archaeon]
MDDMGLEDYKAKRDFQRTREPEGKEGSGEEGIFVVQEHHASHLHYDFRLSLDGVLKSWAVPKGVPEEAKVRRLAVQVEDHPLDYAGFEGRIPKGEYGAGEVKIWDKGTFQLKERSADRLVFVLMGGRLKGAYALVRFKGKEKEAKNWLIMKL